MSDADSELVRGSGNAFEDLGLPSSQAEQLKAALAAQIIGVLHAHGLTVRAAEELTGTAAADFSSIRRAKLDRFTIGRLMMILDRLDQRIAIDVTFG